MSTISDGTTTIPLLLIRSSPQDGANVQHLIIGKPDPDYTIHPARARAGSISVAMRIWLPRGSCAPCWDRPKSSRW